MHSSRLRAIDPDGRPEIVAAVTSGGWSVEPGRPERLRRTFLDTFDGRLLRRRQVAEIEQRRHQPPRLSLIERETARVLVRVDLTGDPARTADGAGALFSWDLPAETTPGDLAAVLDVRALLPYASIATQRRVIGVRNGQTKLVARIVVDDDTLIETDGVKRRRPLGRSVRVEPLRGYERQGDRLTRSLLDLTTLEAEDGDGRGDIVSRILDELDRPPGGIEAPSLDLDPYGPAVEAAVVVLRRLLASIEANRQGTIDELDTEFLHDLRVAVRRTRSGIKAFPGIFRPAPLARFAPGFRWVQQATGPARDLDVQLLEFSDELRKLTPDAAERLTPLRTLLEDRHRTAHLQANRALRSVRFARLLDRWRAFIEDPPLGPDAGRPAVDVASEQIWRAYRRVVKPGRRITTTSPSEDLHDLRKRGKELRYLLEFFAPLYARDDVAPLVRELKSLQDNLGAFQDDQVQAAGLRSYAEELLALTTTPETLIALGELVAHHERTSHDARIEFAERFAAFDRRANRDRFAELFPARRMKVVAMYSIKGGVGKTAAAVNLAWFAARDGLRTLLWDLDPQGAATFLFRIKPRVKGGGKALVRGRRSAADAIRATDFEGLELLPADFSYRHLDLVLDGTKRPLRGLRRVISPVEDEFDLVILDCAPGITLASESVFRAADALLVPIVPSTLSQRTLEQLAAFIADNGVHTDLLPFFSMVDGRKRLHREVMTSLATDRPGVLGEVIPSSTDVERMGVHRAPVAVTAPSSRAALAFEKLWGEVGERLALGT